MMGDLSNVRIKHTNNKGMSEKSSILGPKFNDLIYLRKNVYEFMKEILSNIHSCDVLEIGPRTRDQDLNVSRKLTPYMIYSKEILEVQDNTYKSCDIDASVGADYTFDVNKLPDQVGQAFDVIICCEVMEHSPEFWKMPETFHRLLRENGRIFVSTPFYFLHHDPKPDYWRFTEDGLNLLFEPYFDIEITKLLWQHDDGQRPIHFTLKGIKI